MLKTSHTDTPRMSQDFATSSRRSLFQKTGLTLTPNERVLMMLAASGILAVMGIAIWLTPSPQGFGTHQQLGLPECTFRRLVGISCPHCGMTTSFCWFVRGAWSRSYQANPAGLVLALGCVGLLPWSVMVSVKGRWIGIESPGTTFLYGSAGWLLLSLVIWFFRLA